MDVYLVRRVDTKKIEGIFWGSKAQVWDAVDEECDPVFFEYARLKPGGGIRHRGEGIDVTQWDGPELDDDETPPADFSGFTTTDTLDDALYFQSRLRWKRFDAADTGVGLIARVIRHVEEKKSRS